MSGKRNREVPSSSPDQLQPTSPDPKQAKTLHLTSKRTSNFSSLNNTMSHNDETLIKQNDYIIKLLSSKMDDFERRLTAKIVTNVSAQKNSIDDVTNRIRSIETKLYEIDVIREENRALKEELKNTMTHLNK